MVLERLRQQKVEIIQQEKRNLVDKLQDIRESQRPELYSEIRRICRLPIVEPLTKEECEAFSYAHVQAKEFNQGWRFFECQASAILTYCKYNGLFAPIGVGWGKTLITLCVADKAFKKGKRRVIIFVPSTVYPQLVQVDIPWARTKISLNIPFIAMGNKNKTLRGMLAKQQREGCYIFPYSYLSIRDTSELLESIQPQVLILDEAHYLKNRNSARTKRIMNYISKYEPEIVALSGTITSKSIKDYFHIIRAALHENSPLPISATVASDWAQVIDTNAQPSNAQTGPIKPLVDWAITNFPEEDFPFNVSGFRKAYRKRLNSCPGVVCTAENEIGTSLVIHNNEIQNKESVDGWAQLDEFIQRIYNEWVTPNGDEIEHAIHTFKWLYELSAGFYNELVWPEPDKYAHRKNISIDEAKNRIDKAIDHHFALQEYHKALRDFLQRHFRPGLDTPFLVASDMKQHGAKNVPDILYKLWRVTKVLEFQGMPERDSRAIRVCPYKINFAIDWINGLSKNEGALIWVYNREIGEWIVEEYQGREILHCPSGDRFNEAIINHKNKEKIIVASIIAHGTGKNLQHFQNQLFLQWPRNASIAEQVLGRTHRFGQEADELIVELLSTIEFDFMNFAACLNDSLYIHQSTGDKQKLIYAGYNPMPKIFPSEVLKERGMENRILNVDQRRMLEEKFQIKETE